MVFFGLEAEEYDRNYRNRDLVKNIIQYFKPYRSFMGKVILLMTLTSLTNALIPIIISQVINSTNINEDSGSLISLMTITFVLNFLGWIFNWFQKINAAKAIGNVVLDLEKDASNAVMEQSMDFFDKYPIGKIVSRINSDSSDFSEMMDLLMQAISSLFVIVVVFIPMFVLDYKMSLILMGMIPVVFMVALSFRKVARKKTLLAQRALASVHSFVNETISGIQITKTFRQEERFYDQFRDINKKTYKVNIQRALTLNLLFPVLFFIQNLTIALLFLYGGENIILGNLDSGDFYLFIQNVYLLFFPIFSVASFWPQFQSGLNASERIFSLIDSPKNLKQDSNAPIEITRGEININSLTFKYKEDSEVFNDFNLKIHPGESLAIVGHTGAGKSTLAKILGRFYEYHHGDIFVDGKNIKKVDLKQYRSQIGFIPQTPFIWADTLKENVLFGKPGASDGDVIHALERAGGYDWVEELSDGIETYLHEGGKILSMGQKQLVAFARILLKNPKILILDEATASVDPFTETRIQEALEKTLSNRTTIIIAHRLWTVRKVDRIVVLKEGRIIEEGNHDELMEKGGYYSELYSTYFKHQSFEYMEMIGRED